MKIESFIYPALSRACTIHPGTEETYNYGSLLFFAEKSREKAEQNIFFFFISLSLSLSLFFSRRNTNVLLYHSLTLDIGASVPLGTRREVGWNPTNRE